jgi:hypothetical protein
LYHFASSGKLRVSREQDAAGEVAKPGMSSRVVLKNVAEAARSGEFEVLLGAANHVSHEAEKKNAYTHSCLIPYPNRRFWSVQGSSEARYTP